MQQHKLNILTRESAGSSASRRLRIAGRIPACVYSKGNSQSISISAVEFRDLRRSLSGAAMIELVDEKGETVLTNIQEIQRDIIKNSVNHIDFYEVERGQFFIANIPVHLVGEDESVGVRNEGGILDHKKHFLEVRCIPAKLPDQIDVDVRKLEVGEAVHVGDVEKIEGVEFLDTPSSVIVSCQPPALIQKEEESEEESTAADEVPASKVKSDDEAGAA